MAESIICAVAPNIFERCVGASKEHLGYIWNYKKNMDNLQEQAKKLDDERADKSHSVTVAEKGVQTIKNRAKSWLEKAGKTCEETTEIINDYKEKGQNKCLMGLCPNLILRYQLSKRACKKVTEIVDAVKEAGEIKLVSDQTIGLGKETALSTKVVLPFKSRELVLVNIMKALRDETKNLIGVYGFGGMGKTTLVKQIAKRAEEEKMFEEIVFAPVTQVVELKKIQEKIASMLDLRLNNSSEAESAGLIHERLKGKKVLVILDDLWKELDLNEVGIPCGAEHMSCKILLTSRYLHVLSLMGTKTDFQLNALEEEEAWRLFEEKTIDVIKDPTFLAIGKKVAKKCAGLPVLIVTTAASLSKRPTLPAWNDALKKLNKMENKQIHENVNSAIKSISYNHLEEKHKKLFLLCGLVGGNVSIENLFQYCLGLDMFDGEVTTMGEARDRLHAWILDLKESCLLLDSDNRRDRDSIKMHDVVRGVAISIAEKDFNMLSVEGSGAELNIGHSDDILKRCTRIVFRGGPNLSCLPQQLECPSLELCILSRRYIPSSFSISDTFFEKTGNLKVLDMAGLYFSTLPSSLSFLKNLQAFRVDYCFRLKDISVIGELKKLQILRVFGSGIEELPSEIGQLFELRLLDLSHCSELRIIPADLLAGLSRLEELKMSESFDRWAVEDRFNPSGRANVSLLELNHLPNLTSLEIEVSNAKLLSKDLSFEKWEKYEIVGGDMWSSRRFREWLEKLEITRKVCLQLSSTSINHLQHVVEKLFKRTECLCLGELNGVKNVTPELDVDGFPYMKHLRIKRDYGIQYIVNVEYRQHKASFPALESLHLSHLLELQKICNGRLMEESFYNLKFVKVENCDQLKSLFSFSMAIGLRCLQEIHVSECSVLEAIVAEKNREDDDVNINGGVCEKIEFGKLHKLSLKCLPELNNFFAGKSLTTNVESEEIVAEEAEFKPTIPFFKKVSFPKLGELELSKISNLTRIWSHKLLEMPCCNLTRLTVENCDNLEYLLTPSVSMALVVLRDLIVKSCVKMKTIVAEEEGETKMETVCFPDLTYLCLENLPNLTTFFSVEQGNPNESLFNEKVSFPKMEKLELSRISNLTEIWNQQVPEICNLTTLTVRKCNNLEYLLTPSIATSFVRLQQLTIRSCVRMKHVVAKEEGESKMVTMSFPQLSHLSLQKLPNLITFNCGIDEMDESDNLQAATQPFFDEQVKLPSLKTLEIGNLDSIKIIWPHMSRKTQSLKMDPPKVLNFQTLQRVEVYGCRSLEHVISAYVAGSLNKLEELSIRQCGVETIIGDDKDTEFPTFTFPKLVKLNLNRLSRLKCFYPRKHTTQWPALAEIELSDCGKIQPSMFPLFSIEKVAFLSSMSFKTLLEMEINSCVSLKYLFTPSIAMNLEKLQELTITKCSMMKSIVGNEEGEAIDIIFPQLNHLQLEDMQDLTSFYSNVEDMESNKKLDSQAQPLFSQKIQFPRLEQLTIARLNCINTIWQKQQLYQVKEVTVKNSATRNQINLKKENYEVFSFQNVKKVTVCECASLEQLFPVSAAQSLIKLEELSVEECEELKTIIGDDNYMETPEEVVKATFVFPKLINLKLRRLKKLECFYLREHTCEWPALEVLDVCDCDKVSALDFLRISDKQGHNQFEKVISELKFMSMSCQDMIEIARLYDGHTPQHLFRGLERLTISQFHGEATTFPSKFLSTIHTQLQEFEVYDCSFQEIFPYEGEIIDHVNSDVLLPRLRKLKLDELSELKYICKKEQNSTFIHVLDKLISLYVMECHRLTNLVPSSVSFRLLEYLIIVGCDGMINLMHPSTATSLEHLYFLCIRGCERIEEVIGEVKDDDEESPFLCHEIIFPKLYGLHLKDLPRLRNFSSSRSYTFNFPELYDLQVDECPNMKTLCRGITTAPHVLERDAHLLRSEEQWVISKSEFMTLTSQEMTKILRLYDGHIPQHLFPNLKRLNISQFHGEAATFPSRFLCMIHNQLQTFQVHNCSFQEIFPYEGEVIDRVNNGLLLPQLRVLQLVKLPELKYICKKDQSSTFINVLDKLFNLQVTECHRLTNLVPPSVSFKLLTELRVTNCGGLIHLIQPSTATSLEHLRYMCISECEGIEEIIGEVKDEGSSSFSHEIIFNNLGYLALVKLPRLTNFCSSRNYNFVFPKLNTVFVEECPKMKTFSGGTTTTPDLRRVHLSEEHWVGELNITIEQIYAEREGKRPVITIPSTSSNNQCEAEAQADDKPAEGVSEATMEAQTRHNAANQEKVASIADNGKGKEVEVSKEYFEKSQETPRSSDPSCSNYAARGQTVAAYIAPSQHVGASSSQLSPQISNPMNEVSPLAIEGEVQKLAVSTISPNTKIEEKVEFHDKPTAMLLEPRKEGLICKNGATGELVNQDQVCDNGTNPGKEMVSGNATGLIKGSEIGAEVIGEGLEVETGDKAIKPTKLVTTCGKVEEQTIAVSQASLDVVASSSNSQQKDIQQLQVITKHFIPLLSPALATQVGTTTAAAFSLQKDFQGLRGTEDIVALTSEYFQNLQAREMKSMSAEHVKFMEEASEWFSEYVRQARECVEQNKVISELDLKIAETEALMQALQEKKRAAQEIYEAKASSTLPRFG